MNAVDLFFIIPIAWFAYKGFTRGFIVEISSLLALLVGIYVAARFSFYTTDFLRENFSITHKYMGMLSFIITLVLVILLVILFSRTLEGLIKAGQMGIFNKLAGTIFSVFKVVFVFSVLLFVLSQLEIENSIIKPKYQKSSLLYKPIKSIAPAFFPKLKEFKNNYIQSLEEK